MTVRSWIALFAVTMLATACADDEPPEPSAEPAPTCEAGTEDCPCTYNRRCERGLVCVGWRCVPVGRCGNGIVESNEQCDDGGYEAGDGCSPYCFWENLAEAVDAGATHTCALLLGGRVRCWGGNDRGQLGRGDTIRVGDMLTPAEIGDVKLPGPAIAVTTGEDHTCALLDDGSVWCWGPAEVGQLGHGDLRTIGDDEPAAAAGPVDVGAEAVAIAAAGSSEDDLHRTCALSRGGDLRCWGNGVLGYPNLPIGDDETPAMAGMIALAPVTQIALGGGHTCVQLVRGGLRCWGSGQSGQLGYGTADNVHRPLDRDEDVPVGAPVWSVAAGVRHTCAVIEGSAVRCWGNGGYGRLGYGNVVDIGRWSTRLPSDVGDVWLGEPAKQVAAGATNTCAVLASGKLRCWGAHAEYLGDPERYRACLQAAPWGWCDADPSCCVGDDELPGDVDPIDVGEPVKAVTLGTTHACALLERGAIRCWGAAEKGRLGYGNNEDIGDDEPPSAAGDVPL